ncbi:hypothetical protein V1522DRAFT_410856 [Lipomyces starkeyi]
MPSYAITGASRGLGHEFINQLSSDESNEVFALVRNPSTATKLQILAASRENIHIIKCDVSEPLELVAAAMSVAEVTGGTLDVLIHNAASINMASVGLYPSEYTPDKADFTREVFNEAMGTTVYGAIWATNAFLSLIENGHEKKIVHISSGMADMDLIVKTDFAHALPLCATKAALNVLVAKFAVELKGKGIKVLAISPGWVDTIEGSKLPRMEAAIQALLGQFQKAKPDLRGPISPHDSVRLQLKVIANLDEKRSGKFISHHGDQNWF